MTTANNYWHGVGYEKAERTAGLVADRHGGALAIAERALADADRAIFDDVAPCLDMWDDGAREALAGVLARLRTAAAIVEAVARELDDYDYTFGRAISS